MITTAQTPEMTFTFDDESSAMRAYIRETSKLGIVVRCNDEWLIETTFQQGEWKDVAGRLHSLRIRRVLPAFRKDAILLQSEVPGIGVNFGWQGRCSADIPVDIHAGQGRAAHSLRLRFRAETSSTAGRTDISSGGIK